MLPSACLCHVWHYAPVGGDRKNAGEMLCSLAAKRTRTLTMHSSVHQSAQRRVLRRLSSGKSSDGHSRAAKGRIRGGSRLTLACLLPGIRVQPADFRATHSHNMASGQPAFRWRTILELTVIGSVVYFFLGAPGLSDLLASGPNNVVAAPKTQLLKPNSLVYPSPDLECAQHNYEVHLFSAKPLVIYIDGFLTSEEADALIELR